VRAGGFRAEVAVGNRPEEFVADIRSEIEKWTSVAREAREAKLTLE